MKQNRKWILILSIVLSVAIAAGGTMAYLQDTDEDVNVMTLGNVYINQLEYERVPTEGHELTNDAWVSTGETDKYGYTPDEVRPFTQAKPLFPAVFTDDIVKWDERTGSNGDPHQQSWADVKGEKTKGAPGSFQLFDDSVKNAVDKFVFVENTGNSDAYVRTWFAFEQGDVAAEDFDKVIATNENDAEGESGSGHWVWEKVASDVKIDGNTYVVKVATYLGPKSAPTQVLPAGEISYVSLAQVYMMPEATNDDVIAIDGNKNGTYDILVLSQAVQTQGFASAEAALNEAFGEPTVDNIPWEKVNWPFYIDNNEEMYAATVNGGEYVMGSDYSVDGFPAGAAFGAYRNYAVKDSKNLVIDLNGKTIEQEAAYNGMTYLYTVAYNGSLTFENKGAITMHNPGYTGTNHNNGGAVIAYAQSTGSIIVEDGTYTVKDGTAFWAGNGANITINGGTFIGENTLDYTLIYSSGGVIDIYDGFFQCKGNGGILNVKDTERNTARINLYGGTFVNQDPTKTQDPNNILLAEGYTVVSETQDNGDIWYTVIKE